MSKNESVKYSEIKSLAIGRSGELGVVDLVMPSMATAEQTQLIACARSLFEGVPGSTAQHEANEWLMALQRSDAAWGPALSILQQPPVEHGRVLAAPVLVAVQIVRLKTTEEWPRLLLSHRRLVRDVRTEHFVCGLSAF